MSQAAQQVAVPVICIVRKKRKRRIRKVWLN